MPQQNINLGATGSGAGGDTARGAFEKTQANFNELYPAALPVTAPQKQSARDMLGLGSAATRAAQTGPTDPTAGALLAVGAFGLGSPREITDFGAELRPGFYFAGINAAGRPPNSAGYGLLVTVSQYGNAGVRVQVARMQGTASTSIYWEGLRTALTGPLTWTVNLHTGSILGTVAQSAGVPTGAIIERGSNANGEYVRFADGTQICTRRSDEAVSAVAQGNIFSGVLASWTFPAPFFEVQFVSFAPRAVGAWGGVNNANLTAAAAEGRVFSTSALNAVAVSILRVAIGRWY